MKIDIAEESIPPAIIISYMRKFSCIVYIDDNSSSLFIVIYIIVGVLFTGKKQQVTDETGVPVHDRNGKVRVGKGFAESTFRKQYHALHTLHVHLQLE